MNKEKLKKELKILSKILLVFLLFFSCNNLVNALERENRVAEKPGQKDSEEVYNDTCEKDYEGDSNKI